MYGKKRKDKVRRINLFLKKIPQKMHMQEPAAEQHGERRKMRESSD